MDLVELAPDITRRHPWEEARFRFFVRLLASEGLLGDRQTVLDVGAGDTWFARQLARAAPAIARVDCWDTGYSDAMLAAGAEDRVTLMRSVPGRRYGLVLLLDVVEHVPDDAGFVAAIARDHLAPSGRVLMSVPSWPALFTSHDVTLRHRRRYTPANARGLVTGAGLRVVRSGGLFPALLPIRALHAAAERLTGRATHIRTLGEWRAGTAVTRVVDAALAVDAVLARAGARLGVDVPGLSWWALCQA